MTHYCPNCKYPNPSNRDTCFKCGEDISKKEEYTEDVVVSCEEAMNGFNLGAFTFTPLWGLYNGVYLALLSPLLLCCILYRFVEIPSIVWGICGILQLGISIYYGFTGNVYAYKGGRFNSEVECLACQAVWIKNARQLVFVILAILFRCLIIEFFQI